MQSLIIIDHFNDDDNVTFDMAAIDFIFEIVSNITNYYTRVGRVISSRFNSKNSKNEAFIMKRQRITHSQTFLLHIKYIERLDAQIAHSQLLF